MINYVHCTYVYITNHPYLQILSYWSFHSSIIWASAVHDVLYIHIMWKLHENILNAFNETSKGIIRAYTAYIHIKSTVYTCE